MYRFKNVKWSFIVGVINISGVKNSGLCKPRQTLLVLVLILEAIMPYAKKVVWLCETMACSVTVRILAKKQLYESHIYKGDLNRITKFVYVAMCSLVSQAGMVESYKVESVQSNVSVADNERFVSHR